jgi:hypothetical protein
MKSTPEKTKTSLTRSIRSIFAAPSQSAPHESDRKTQTPREHIERPATFWELLNDADLRVVTEPWPPQPGVGRLRAEMTAPEGGGKFEGTMAYRIAKKKKNSAAWQPLSRTSTDKHGSVYFETPITLGKGTAYIQFRVCGAGEHMFRMEFLDLTDWKLKVQ